MATVITCDQCNAQMSKNASICPGCHAPPKSNRGQCRACGQVLAVSNHRYIDYVSSVVVVNGQGGSRSSAFIHHVPCPKCFEPKPLLQYVDRPFAKFLAVLGILVAVASFAAMAVSMMTGGPLDKFMSTAGQTGKIFVAAGVIVAALVGFGLFGFGITTLNATNKYLNKMGGFRAMRLFWIVAIGGFLIAMVIAVATPSHKGSADTIVPTHETVKKKHKQTVTPAHTTDDLRQISTDLRRTEKEPFRMVG